MWQRNQCIIIKHPMDNRNNDEKIHCDVCKRGDLNTLELRYKKINDKDYGKAFDIPPGSSWRACVSLFGQDNVVRLIHYKTKLCKRAFV